MKAHEVNTTSFCGSGSRRATLAEERPFGRTGLIDLYDTFIYYIIVYLIEIERYLVKEVVSYI
jgi:hypothetical protein